MHRADFQKNLPQLKTTSQIKFRSTSKGHSYTEEGKNKEDSKMMTLRQQNSTSYASKVIRYQTSGVIYSKKKQEEEIRLKNIEAQINSIEKELQKRRRAVTQQKRVRDPLLIEQQKDDVSMFGVSDRDDKKGRKKKTINLNDPKEMRSEIEQTLKSIQHFKKKVNTMKNQNTLVYTEVNKYRKQINTIKQHVWSLDNDLEEQSDTYESILQENKIVSEQVANKYLELHQKKAERAHEQTKKLKRYDEVLRSITRQIEDQKLKTFGKPNFYMTEINHSQIKSPTRSPGKRSLSPSKRRLNLPLNQLQSMLKEYEQHFTAIKQQAGTDDMDKIGEQYIQNQKQTYAMYRFINGLSDELKQKLQEQEDLQRRLTEAKQGAVFKYTSAQQAALYQMEQNLQKSKRNNRKSREDQMTYERIIKDLKLSIPVMIERLKMTSEDYPELSEFNMNKLQEEDLITLLIIIQKCKNQIIDANQVSENKVLKLNQYDVQEQIQNAKKQFVQYQRTQSKNKEFENKYQKFLDQNQLIKTLDLTSRSKKEKRPKN